MTDVSIILVSYNTKDLTRECIKSIYEKTKDINYEIIVVDNNSQDGSCEMLEAEFPSVRLIKNPDNKGFGAANNIGIRMSAAKYIFCLNTDTLLLNNAIKIMFDYMEQNPDVAVCGGNMYDKNLKPSYNYSNFWNTWNCTFFYWITKAIFKKQYAPKEIKKVKEVDFITGADIFFRKSVLDKVGLFDENIFMYSEDIDICKRIKNCGYSIKAIPEPKILHYGGSCSKDFLKKMKLNIKSKYYYIRKHNSKFCLYCMKIPYVIVHFLCYLFTFNKDHYDLMLIHSKG